MNILVICHYLGEDAPATIYIHDQMKAFVEAGHRVRCAVLLPWGKQAYGVGRLSCAAPEIDGVEYRYVRYLSLSNFGDGNGWNIRFAVSSIRCQLRRVLGDLQPDVIHAHTLGVSSACGAYCKRVLQRPLVVTTHGSDTSVPMERGQHQRMRMLCRDVDRVVAVSSALGDKLRQCGTSIPICTILNGFALQQLDSTAEKTQLSFLQVSNLLPQKGVHTTIRAFARIHETYPDARLVIIGQGPQREALEELCDELGVADAVRFCGRLPNSKVLAEMSKTRFFVMPSVREGFGIVYLEAMACGCITIGTQGEGISDLIVNGENGFLVPADNPERIVQIVKHCLENSREADELAQRGSIAARQLTWYKNAERYLQLFSSLISRVS